MGNDAAQLEFRSLFGPEGGPPCDVCHQLPSVCPGDARGLMCHRCLQDADNMRWAYYLNFKYRTNPGLADPIIMFNVAGFILGTGLNRYCQCGECDPNWFLRGWVCYDVRLTKQPVGPASWEHFNTSWTGWGYALISELVSMSLLSLHPGIDQT